MLRYREHVLSSVYKLSVLYMDITQGRKGLTTQRQWEPTVSAHRVSVQEKPKQQFHIIQLVLPEAGQHIQRPAQDELLVLQSGDTLRAKVVSQGVAHPKLPTQS